IGVPVPVAPTVNETAAHETNGARTAPQEITPVTAQSASRTQRLLGELKEVFEEASGIDIGDSEVDVTFLELGLDSLFLTQVALALQKKLGVKVTFRQLLEEMPTLQTLAEYMDRQLPPDAAPAQAPAAAAAPAAPAAPPAPPAFGARAPGFPPGFGAPPPGFGAQPPGMPGAPGYPPQPGYPQAGYPGYPQAGYPQAGYPQPGHPQAGYPQPG